MAKRALIVGIDNYSILDPTGKTNLSACVNDARSINQVLRDGFGFTEIYHLEDLRASRDRILSTLRHLIRISETGDSICFYFSGHGARVRADLSQADCDLYYEALVPASGAWITDRDLIIIAGDLYPDAINFTMITDACHSGGLHTGDAALKCRTPEFSNSLIEAIVNFLRTLIPCGICIENISQLAGNVSNVHQTTNGTIDLDPDPDKTLIAATKSTLLAGCHFNELSWESSALSHGLFTQSILDLINQSNMQITYHDIMEQLRTSVADKIQRIIHPSRPGVTQTPQLFGQRNRMVENFLEGWTFTPAEQ